MAQLLLCPRAKGWAHRAAGAPLPWAARGWGECGGSCSTGSALFPWCQELTSPPQGRREPGFAPGAPGAQPAPGTWEMQQPHSLPHCRGAGCCAQGAMADAQVPSTTGFSRLLHQPPVPGLRRVPGGRPRERPAPGGEPGPAAARQSQGASIRHGRTAQCACQGYSHGRAARSRHTHAHPCSPSTLHTHSCTHILMNTRVHT